MEGINPKQACGQAKPPHSTVPLCVLAEVGVGMFEGARKYGRHNYRTTKIIASIYYDATRRHLDSWFEGENEDPDSGLSHVTKAICSLVVLRDSMINDMVVDDRPPRVLPWHKEYLQGLTDEIVARHPMPKEASTEVEHQAFERRMANVFGEMVRLDAEEDERDEALARRCQPTTNIFPPAMRPRQAMPWTTDGHDQTTHYGFETARVEHPLVDDEDPA